ncbi:MFS transporter [Leekyejoonella antrihumi]|uniref:MFS transporter n=1 Tax=Leekyejoonella antrihumi TaxID=1660198 RepID=A0A563DTH1_9MICO|nr:MFS transporter [Leekyejoonella antrihumi]
MLAVLTAAGFLVFAQAFMVAPLLPRLAQQLGTSVGMIGLSVPAYLVPYGVMTLFWGPLADRFGRRPVILVALALFSVLSAATMALPTVGWFIGARVATGLGASGIVPVSLMLIGDVIPYEQRGHAIGWLFGGMAGGMAVGSTAGALVEPSIGWQGLFLVVAGVGAVVLAAAVRSIPRRPRPMSPPSARAAVRGYVQLLQDPRGRRTYEYVGFNAVLQSGIYTWLGLYLHQRFGLGPVGIGLGLLGYGIPGFALGPLIGRLADRHGRARLIPAGLALATLASAGLAAPAPLILVAILVALLSMGYDLTQPLLAGIVTDLPGHRGQSVALMAVVLFCGFGAGSLVFQAVLSFGFVVALAVFGAAAGVAALVAVPVFSAERSGRLDADGPQVDVT